MFQESELLPLSALQHLAFCERQCALIHLEQTWSENLLTAKGRQMHKRSDEYKVETRGNVRIVRSLRLQSLKLGLSGKADVVEFHKMEKSENKITGTALPGVKGRWKPFPVEYKHGKPKKNPCDKIQLCAQAMCLEEMLDTKVLSGALFYGRTRKRLDVAFDDSLRNLTEFYSAKLHQLFKSGKTPPPVFEKKCKSCSLFSECMPRQTEKGKFIERYILKNLEEKIS